MLRYKAWIPFEEDYDSNAYIDRACEESERFQNLIKEELVTREHIPNKQESKQLRKVKMAERKNRSQLKYVNR